MLVALDYQDAIRRHSIAGLCDQTCLDVRRERRARYVEPEFDGRGDLVDVLPSRTGSTHEPLCHLVSIWCNSAGRLGHGHRFFLGTQVHIEKLAATPVERTSRQDTLIV